MSLSRFPLLSIPRSLSHHQHFLCPFNINITPSILCTVLISTSTISNSILFHQDSRFGPFHYPYLIINISYVLSMSLLILLLFPLSLSSPQHFPRPFCVVIKITPSVHFIVFTLSTAFCTSFQCPYKDSRFWFFTDIISSSVFPKSFQCLYK